MLEIGVVDGIYTENQRGWTINLRIKFAEKFGTFGNRKLLDAEFDIGMWWLKRIAEVFEIEDAFACVGRGCLCELHQSFGGVWTVRSIAKIDGTRCFNPESDIPRRME